MALHRLREGDENAFREAAEVFADVQLGLLEGQPQEWGIVIGCDVVVTFDDALETELRRFYDATWSVSSGTADIVARYDTWLRTVTSRVAAIPHPVDRRTFAALMLSAPYPPPPPGRPTLTPIVPPSVAPPTPPAVYGHLPFRTKTQAQESFYRFEAWPTSRKLIPGKPGKPGMIAAGTYASPELELPFLPSGFAAVARNALPSFFPAVFKYDLEPVTNSDILCGAIIPNYGQSGGGVEVFFPNAVSNRGPFKARAIVPPF